MFQPIAVVLRDKEINFTLVEDLQIRFRVVNCNNLFITLDGILIR
jgi:hypothetical protein